MQQAALRRELVDEANTWAWNSLNYSRLESSRFQLAAQAMHGHAHAAFLGSRSSDLQNSVISTCVYTTVPEDRQVMQ